MGKVVIKTEIPGPRSREVVAREAAHLAPGLQGFALWAGVAMARGEGFTGAFPGETDDDDLEALREIFTRKALIGRQGTICEGLINGGTDRAELVGMTVAQLPDTPEARRVLELREMLGIAADDDAPAFVNPNGEGIVPEQLDRWLRGARLVRVSLEANGSICRGLLQGRHKLAPESEN